MTKDEADLHVERWRDHWVLDQGFDDGVEAMTVRIGTIHKRFRAAPRRQWPGSGCRTSSTRPCTP